MTTARQRNWLEKFGKMDDDAKALAETLACHQTAMQEHQAQVSTNNAAVTELLKLAISRLNKLRVLQLHKSLPNFSVYPTCFTSQVSIVKDTAESATLLSRAP